MTAPPTKVNSSLHEIAHTEFKLFSSLQERTPLAMPGIGGQLTAAKQNNGIIFKLRSFVTVTHNGFQLLVMIASHLHVKCNFFLQESMISLSEKAPLSSTV